MSRNVLVVEDETPIADTIRYALETDGFTVAWYGTGAEALTHFRAQAVDLVVLDVGLPDCNGFDLCKTIRETSAVPVVFLTARADEIDRVVGLEIGGDDYMVKPFSPRELSARVRAILRRSTPSPAPATTPFLIDHGKMRIVYSGTALDLSRYEFRLLNVLVGRPGWVFSREQLMDLVWEEPEASMDRTVDTHIKTLRAKLKAVRADVDPIQTHRGLGYSLREDL